MRRIFILSIILLSIQYTSFSQGRIVHGVIHTFDSIPLIGVDVVVKSTKQSVKTDSIGRFSVLCSNKDKLKVKATGFYTENVKVTDKTKLVAVNLRLKPGDKQRQYAIGYGYVNEEDLTTSINNLESTDMRFSRFSNMSEIIRSMGAEVRGGQVVIRGSKTFSGNDGALIVVDDAIVENDILNTISPLDVKSVNIIKDGASSVYGSRGANGVVIIETKKGK